MSTTLLYKSFGILGYQQTRIEFTGGVTRFHVTPSENSVCCSSCGSDNVIRRGVNEREFKASPIGLKPTDLDDLSNSGKQMARSSRFEISGASTPDEWKKMICGYKAKKKNWK